MSLLMLVPDIHDVPGQFNKTGPDGIPERLRQSIESKKWIAEVVQERNVDLVVQMGDYWDKPEHLDGPTILHSLASWQAIPAKTIVLRGNHDYTSVYDASQLLAFCSNTTVITEPQSLYLQAGNAFLGFLPYYRTEPVFTEAAAELAKKAQQHGNDVRKYLFIHQGIQGFIPNADDAFSAGCIDHVQWTKIFSGHYHSGFSRGFIHYLGSLIPTAFEPLEPKGSATMGKGVTLLDTKTGEITFLANPYSPIFITCDIEDYPELVSGLTPEEAAAMYIKVRHQTNVETANCDLSFLPKFKDYVLEKKMSTQEKERNKIWKSINIRAESSVLDLAVDQLDLKHRQNEDFVRKFRKIGETDILRKS